MKKLIFLTSLLMVLIFAPMVMADQVMVYRELGYFSGNGGEFTLKIIDNAIGPNLDLNWTYYNPTFTRDIGNNDPSFQTFCVEIDEYVGVPGGPYNVVINNMAVGGGKNTNSGDPLSKGTAWLYYMFATGQLTGYDYTISNRSTSAGLLQNAIWYLEEEITTIGSNLFIDLVTSSSVFGSLPAAMADNNGLFPVAVLNLYQGTTLKQDQLVLVPEPATMLLLGSGLIGLAGFARRRFKK